LRVLLALVAGLGVSALLLGALLYLSRSFLLIRRLAFPLSVAAIAAGLKIFTLFQTGLLPAFESALSWILIFLPAVVVLRIFGLYFFEIHVRSHREIQLPPLIPPMIMALAYLITAFVTVRVIYPDLNLGPLVATSAITSLVLGLALQPILGNLFAGVVISLERPFRINDWVKVANVEGRVVGITWRTTRLRTRENDDLVIPNGKIAEEPIINYYYPHPMHVERLRVSVDYQTPPYRVQQALLNCLSGVTGVLDKPSPEVQVASFDDSAITYELRIWVDDVAQAPRIGSDIRARVWEEFRRKAMTIPYPTMTLERPNPRVQRALRDRTQPASARLFVTEGPERGASLTLDGHPLVIGRASSCGLVVTEPQASKEHCRIEWTPDGYVLTDLQSKFGTNVNGVQTSRRVLADSDHIAIGATSLVFEIDAS
jgi:small-conductance mechanosensitive channel